jgi:hypothetical protein
MSGATPSLLYTPSWLGGKGLLFAILIPTPPYQFPRFYTLKISLLTLESQHFTPQIFYLLTTCQPPDQGGKTLLPTTSLLHNPSPSSAHGYNPLAQHYVMSPTPVSAHI